MMTSKPDNPPAFPMPSDVLGHFEGMTLRDYFAAAILTGLTGNPALIEAFSKARSDCGPHHLAYELADAMLKAREQE